MSGLYDFLFREYHPARDRARPVSGRSGTTLEQEGVGEREDSHGFAS